MDSSKARLLTLLELLQVYRNLSGEEIARRLEVSPRTVRRYVAGLQEMGIPVEAVRGRVGGYRMRPGFKLPPLMFTNDEALLVVLGLITVQRLGLAASGPAAQGALAKLDRVLPASLRDRLQAAREMLDLGLSPVARGHADGETVLVLSSAARDQIRLRIHYRSADDVHSDRVIDPYGITFQSGHWYLVAWDHLRDAMRSFRLDRMQSVEPTGDRFERPDDFALGDYMKRTLATMPYRWNAEIRLETSLERARQLVNPAVGVVEPHDGAVRLRIGADDLEWIVRYLAELGVDFSVIAPPELRRAIRVEASRLAACARRFTSTRPAGSR